MTGSPPELRSFLEAEMFYGVKKRERIAYAVAGGGLAIGLMGMIAVVTMLPLKQTEAFLAIVDKDTGVAERVVAVEKAGIEQAEAIRQSLLFAYVTDRETYDQHDNESRILRAYTWSEGNARQGLVSLWTEGNANYPPKLYGQNSKVVIDVLSITPVTDTTALVITVASPITAMRSGFAGTPRACASASGRLSTFIRQRSRYSAAQANTTTGAMAQTSSICRPLKLPSSQKVIAGSWS